SLARETPSEPPAKGLRYGDLVKIIDPIKRPSPSSLPCSLLMAHLLTRYPRSGLYGAIAEKAACRRLECRGDHSSKSPMGFCFSLADVATTRCIRQGGIGSELKSV